MSAYDPILPERAAELDDGLEEVRDRFSVASRPYLSTPWSWLAWGTALPTAALTTPLVAARGGPVGVLFLWSGAILLAGLVEIVAISRHRQRSALGSWAMRVQGNLSFVALVLSGLLLWLGQAWTLPGLWLLAIGHSFYLLGSLSLPALRRYGLAYQIGGLLALVPGGRPLEVFALTTLLSNLGLALSIARAGRRPPH